ncbi:O-antigen translocase [Aegicerativicinus sediminis]|uniref:O-antigen translocase n=1 Tax=Aegicerativicinus sediminis TaxID=2893202 RepID=UPI001E2A8E9D|nr:O-antigen translocase [Aegicerativicinus sediminis]
MKQLLRYINDHVLIRVAQLNTATIITKILAGLITSKAIALLIGVEGMALIGNIRNFVTAAQSFAILGFYKGLVKHISVFKSNIFRLSETISTAYYLGFFSTFILSFIFYYNAEFFNSFLFTSGYNFSYIIKIFALALPFYSLNMFCFSILNGFSKYKLLLIINIIGQVLGVLITLVLIYQNNIDGALIASVIAPSLVFMITAIGVINRRSLVSQVKISNVSIKTLERFGPFALMALVTSVGLPLVYIFIRKYIISTVGISEAGYWEAINRLSDYYLLFVNSVIALYIVPKFQNLKTKIAVKEEIKKLYKAIIPVLVIGLVVIYLLRYWIIKLFFTDDFLPATDLFFWQLMGDFLKVLSIVIAYQFIAKKMFMHFVIIELFLVVMLYFSSVYLIDIFGLEGVVMGHFFSHLMYYGIILLIFGTSMFRVIGNDNK